MRRNKYNNKKVIHDGIAFDSKKEGARYCELKLLERAGEIRNVGIQPKYDFELNNIKICSYVADFRYYDIKKQNQIIEDVKGFKTPMYRLKKKMMKAFHGIDILET